MLSLSDRVGRESERVMEMNLWKQVRKGERYSTTDTFTLCVPCAGVSQNLYFLQRIKDREVESNPLFLVAGKN